MSRLDAHDHGRRASPASRARARCTCASRDGRGRRRASCGSTSRRASSRRSCAAARFTEAPDITARICGICPVAYQMSALRGDRGRAAASTVDGPIRDAAPAALLRRVDREPRAARLHAARARLPRLRRARSRWRATTARSSSAGCGSRRPATRSCAWSAGARSTRSTCASAASTARPRARELRAAGRAARAGARGRARDGALDRRRSPFPDFERDYEFVALRDAGRLPDRRRAARRRAAGSTSRPREYEDALRRGARRRTRPRCTRGCASAAPTSSARSPATPQLRPALAAGARGGARGRRSAPVCRNPFQSIVVRSVEILYALDEALRLIAAYEPPDRAGGRGRAARRRPATAGPRRRAGMLWHRYEIDDDGHDPRRARSCRRPRRTRRAIEEDLRDVRRSSTSSSRTTSCGMRCEQAIRNYDPCISCATHFLTLEVERALTAGHRRRQRVARRRRRRPRSPALGDARRRLEHEGEPLGAARRLGGRRTSAVVDRRRQLGRARRARSTASTPPPSRSRPVAQLVLDPRVRPRRGDRARARARPAPRAARRLRHRGRALRGRHGLDAGGLCGRGRRRRRGSLARRLFAAGSATSVIAVDMPARRSAMQGVAGTTVVPAEIPA